MFKEYIVGACGQPFRLLQCNNSNEHGRLKLCSRELCFLLRGCNVFLRFFIFCFVVAIGHLVHAVEAMYKCMAFLKY